MASVVGSRQSRKGKISSFFVLLFFCSTMPSLSIKQQVCPSGLNSVPSTIKIARDYRESIRSQTDVAMRITKPLLLTEGNDKNMVYSPLSIHVILSLMAAAAEGPVKDQLLSFLKSNSTAELNSFVSTLIPLLLSDSSSSGGPQFSFANGVWVDKSLSIKPSFKQVVDMAYKAPVEHVDFRTKAEQVRIEVNSWVEKETKGLINEILPAESVDSLTDLIFANALYFKGAWGQEFDSSRTKEHDFHLIDGTSVTSNFMTSDEKQFVRAFEGFKVLELPYEQVDSNARFSMYLILPDARDGLPALVDKVCSEPDFLESHRPHKKVELNDFKIPTFKLSRNFEASRILKDLGLVLPFTSGLTGIIDSSFGELKLMHASSIEVNEQGTEAGAASAVFMLGSINSAPEKIERIDFVADHPFMFVVREKITRTMLFIGQVMNPLAG